MAKILILGASGNVGSALAQQLTAAGETVVRATSKKENLQADQVHYDIAQNVGLEAALEGVDRAFVLMPPGYTNQDVLAAPLFAAARERGLKKVVFMTAMGANADPNAPMRKAEIALEQSGIPYNIIRPNWFMQNFNSFWIQGILEQGKIFLPVGDAKGSFIDARDIAAVAATLLTSDTFANRDFDLTGAESLDHHEVAAILSEVTGKTITYQEVSPEAMRSNLLAAGLPADYSEFLLLILSFFKLGYSAAVLPTVEEITGKAPISFRQYAQDYRQAWL
jgi:uncharacterized protein YbjT (DUF2867 family)